jgi:hypothetical protein
MMHVKCIHDLCSLLAHISYYLSTLIIRTNLLIVAKCTNSCFTLCCVGICTNMESPPQFAEIWSFLKYIPAAKISKMPRFRSEHNVKRKIVQHESCCKFSPDADLYNILLKRNSDAMARPRSLKGTKAALGFRKLVTWLTQTLAIWNQFGQATTWTTCVPL